MTAGTKLGIGTVQFGLKYGLGNLAGQTPETETRRILARAHEIGCKVIDTAAVYGESELVLGRTLPKNVPVHIVTKTVPMQGKAVDEAAEIVFRTNFFSSLRRLNRDSVYGILVHHHGDLLGPGGDRLFAILQDLRDAGYVERIGVSAYDSDAIDAVFSRFDLDLVQLPISVLDQRLIADGSLCYLKNIGVEVHARSVFLQGLLVMPEDTIPKYFQPLLKKIKLWHERVVASQRSAVGAAFSFVSNLEEVDFVIVGFNTLAQLDTLLLDSNRALPFRVDDLACDDPTLINPNRWNLS